MIDTVELAKLYSQLAGVLAGFAFVALMSYMGPGKSRQRSPNVATSLFSTFASLVLVAVLYALLAGDVEPRASTHAIVNGVPLGLAIITLFYTLTLSALERTDLVAVVRFGRMLVVLTGPSLVMARLGVAGYDIARHESGNSVLWLAAGLCAVQIAVGFGLLSAPWRLLRPLTPYAHVAVHLPLGAAVFAMFVTAVMSTRSSEFRLPSIAVMGELVAAFLVLLLYAVLAASALRGSPGPLGSGSRRSRGKSGRKRRGIDAEPSRDVNSKAKG